MRYLSNHNGEKSMVFHYIYLVFSIFGAIFGGIGLVAIVSMLFVLYDQLMSVGVAIDSLTLMVTFITSIFALVDYLLLVFVVVGLIFWKRWLPSLVHIRMVLTCWINGATFLFTVFQFYQAKFFETQPLETVYSLLIDGIQIIVICGIYWLIDLYYQERESYFTK